MPTQTEIDRLLADLGASADTFESDEITDLFTRAGEDYPAGSQAVIFAAARVYGARQLIAKLTPQLIKYKQGESSEDPTPVLDGLKALLSLYEKALTATLGSTQTQVRFAGLRRKPTYEKEYPDS